MLFPERVCTLLVNAGRQNRGISRGKEWLETELDVVLKPNWKPKLTTPDLLCSLDHPSSRQECVATDRCVHVLHTSKNGFHLSSCDRSEDFEISLLLLPN